MLTRQQAIRGAQNFVLIFLSIGVVALYSSWRRPIWTDEALHFVWGANPIGLEAIQGIIQSTKSINHGQTGIYIVINHLTLNATGADLVALRAPSLLAGLLLLLLAALFLRALQFGWLWQVLSILAMGSMSYVMYFAGEARPYLPLATATVGTLCYYSCRAITLGAPSSPLMTCVGWASVLLGISFHPYFIGYWLALLILTYAWSCQADLSRLTTVRFFVRFINPKLCLSGSLLLLAVGFQSWIRGQPSFDLNPFEYQARENLPRIFLDAHFNFVWPYKVFAYAFVATLITVLVLLMISKARNPLITPLWMPISLIVLAGVITLGLSIVSYLTDYWILSRQWIASMALIPIAYVWFFAILSRQLMQSRQRAISTFIFGLATVPVVLAFGERVGTQLDRLREYSAQFSEIEVPIGELTDAKKQQLWAELGWDATNVNVKVGGPVWDVFKQ